MGLILRLQHKPIMRHEKLITLLIIATSITILASNIHAENIDPAKDDAQYAWSENTGWLNLEPLENGGPGVTVDSSILSGYIWGENVGWINVNPVLGGVVNNGKGKLSGFAWGENVGWINFSPVFGGGVTINACGEFNGYAWGENIGWISFRSEGLNPFIVKTSWVSPVDTVAPETVTDTPVLLWYTSDVSLGLTATDCGHGVQEVRYMVDSDPEVIVPGSTASVNISSDGCHTLIYYAIDVDGNTETPFQGEICIDTNPPEIAIITPPDGATYNLNEVVIADYTVTDTLSGISITTAPVPDGSAINTTATGPHSFIVSATDNAGNSNAVIHSYSVDYAGNMDPDDNGSQYAWGENVGWINLQPAWGDGVTVTDSTVTGNIWGENIGWINLNPAFGGVINDGAGNLTGYAWGENVGWINFNPTTGGVTIDSNGIFSGYAWGENIGWINFSPIGGGPATSWRPDVDGDGYRSDVDCDDSNPEIYPGGPPIRVVGNSVTYNATLDGAYYTAFSGDTIQSKADIFNESVDFNRSISVTIESGYDCAFATITGITIMNGNMTVSNGSVTIQSGTFGVQ